MTHSVLSSPTIGSLFVAITVTHSSSSLRFHLSTIILFKFILPIDDLFLQLIATFILTVCEAHCFPEPNAQP